MVRPFTFIKKFPATFTEFCKFAKLLSINTRRHPVFSSRNTIARNGEFYILKKEITRTKFEQNSRNLLAILQNQRNFLLSKIHFLFNRSVNFLSIEINFALVRFTNPPFVELIFFERNKFTNLFGIYQLYWLERFLHERTTFDREEKHVTPGSFRRRLNLRFFQKNGKLHGHSFPRENI